MWHIGTCILSIYIHIPIRLLLSLRQQPQLSQRAKTQILGVMRKTVGIAEFLWFLVEASRMVSRKHASFMDVFVFSMYGHLGTPQKSYIDTKNIQKWWLFKCISFQICLFGVSMLGFGGVILLQGENQNSINVTTSPRIHSLAKDWVNMCCIAYSLESIWHRYSRYSSIDIMIYRYFLNQDISLKYHSLTTALFTMASI